MLKWVSWLLAIIIVSCMLASHVLGSLEKGIIVGSLLLATLGLLVYLVMSWKRIPGVQRWGIIFSIPVWLLLMYGFLRPCGPWAGGL